MLERLNHLRLPLLDPFSRGSMAKLSPGLPMESLTCLGTPQRWEEISTPALPGSTLPRGLGKALLQSWRVPSTSRTTRVSSWMTRSLYPDCGQGVNRLAEQGTEEYRRMKMDLSGHWDDHLLYFEGPQIQILFTLLFFLAALHCMTDLRHRQEVWM